MPKFLTALRRVRELTAFVAMPKATMYKNNRLVSWQDDIRIAGKVFSVQAKTIAHRVQH
jgi:hypothetical protein